MAIGKVLGEFMLKGTSIRQTDLGGDRRRVEIDLAGETTGEVPGQNLGTLSVEISGDPTRPAPWTYTGVVLARSGAVVQVSGSGCGIRMGNGHKVRYRGVATYHTDDPKLEPFNHMIAAIESEADPATMTLKGMSCEWN